MARSTRAQPDFEKSIAELEDIVRQMEDGEIGLEQSLNLYQRGIALVRGCREALDGAEQRIRQLHDGELSELTAARGDDA
ncbi:MAG: exodeoxyribonuclease VII small subunit [Rhodocyclaceae bacterium]|nr:exodeoxyribonuclease VII small subunit [Rhodocyclaceae bacterium]